MGPAVSKDKKLIAWICDQIDTAEMRRRAAEMEQMPLDGVVITVRPDASSKTVGRYSGWFGGRRHSRDEFKQAIADLKEAGFRGLTDNFMDFETSVRHDPAPEEANLDWFDPNWSVVADNSAVAAYVAKEGGLKGFFLDLEGYGGGPGAVAGPVQSRRLHQAGERSRQDASHLRRMCRPGPQARP